jgi:hypothetical protein
MVLWVGAGAGGQGLSHKGEGSTEGHKEKREQGGAGAHTGEQG